MNPPFVFTLIHGTFRPNAEWARPGSTMRVFLEGRFPGCLITAPKWSGINTHAERLKASDDIGKVLLRQRQEIPDARHFVIAHSHGGTITLHACADDLVRISLSGVATLGTPFIHSRRRDLRVPIRLYKEVVTLGRNLWLVWQWAFALIFFGLLSIVYDVANEAQHFPSVVGKTVNILCLILFAGFVFFSIKLRLKRTRLHAWIAGPLKKSRARQRALYAARREPYRFVRDLRLLAFSVGRDEARMVLRMLRGAGGLAHFVHEVLSYSIRWAVYVSFALGFAVLLNRLHLFYERTPDATEFLMRSSYGIAKFQLQGLLWVTFLSLSLHGLMILWPVIRLHKYGYGEMSLWPNWLLDIHDRKSPGSGPKWSFMMTRSQAKFGGRHSFFYDDPSVLADIGKWIESPELFPVVASAGSVTGKRRSTSIVVLVVSWILLIAFGIWLWLHPIRIYHIHS